MSTKQGIIIPAYFYPGNHRQEWGRLAQAASVIGKKLIVIANPDSGPGASRNQLWSDVIDSVRGNGGCVVGYVYTCNHDPASTLPNCPRTEDSITRDIDTWYGHYPMIDGLFFDQVSPDQNDVNYYNGLYRYVQNIQSWPLVVYNFGTMPHEDFFGIGSSLLCIYENTYANFSAEFHDFNSLCSMTMCQRNRSLVLLHHTPSDSLLVALKQLKEQDIGWIYFTSGDWDTFPAYFEAIVQFIQAASTRIVSGSTPAGNTDWRQYQNGIYVDVDTSSAGFTNTPVYVTSLAGTSNHWTTMGGSSVYLASPSGFRVYIRKPQLPGLTPRYANDKEWHINWIGCGD